MCLDDLLRTMFMSTSNRQMKLQPDLRLPLEQETREQRGSFELQSLERLDPADVRVKELFQSLRGQPVLQCVPTTLESSSRLCLEFIIAIPNDIRSRLMTMILRKKYSKKNHEKTTAPSTTTATAESGSTSTNVVLPWTKTAVERIWEETMGPSTANTTAKGPPSPLRCSLTISAVNDSISVFVNRRRMDVEDFVAQLVEGPQTGATGLLLNVEVDQVLAVPQELDTMAKVWCGPLQLKLKWQGKSIVFGNTSTDVGFVYIKGSNWPAANL